MTNKEAIDIVENMMFNMGAKGIRISRDEDEAIEKLIRIAEATRWVKLMGDLSMLFDLDTNRYKINKEDWIADKAVPLDEFLDDLYEVINDKR